MKGKEEIVVSYGGTEIEEVQVGVGLQLVLFGCLFAAHIGAFSASIGESIWARGITIISISNAVQIASYFTTMEGGFRGGFANGVAAFLSSACGLNRGFFGYTVIPIVGVSITSNNDFIGSRFSATIGAHVAIVKSEFEDGFGGTILAGFIGFNTGGFATRRAVFLTTMKGVFECVFGIVINGLICDLIGLLKV